jgi:tetratricopeptide (TPR) repeat protein
MGRDREAYSHLVNAVELFDQEDLPWMKGTSLVHLANVSLGMNEYEQALHWLDMARPYMEDSEDPWNLAFMANNYGEIARARGQIDEAEKFYRQTEGWYEQADAVGDQARLVHTFGYIALHQNDHAEAAVLFQKSLADFRTLGNVRGIAECLAGLAAVAAVRDQHSLGAELLGAAHALLEAFGGRWWPADRVEIENTQALLAENLGDAFESAYQRGVAMTREDAVKLAGSV